MMDFIHYLLLASCVVTLSINDCIQNNNNNTKRTCCLGKTGSGYFVESVCVVGVVSESVCIRDGKRGRRPSTKSKALNRPF